jgi:pyruvate dehydrogenase E1 component
MFGFQRVGDFIWAAGDSRARGFLVGGTAGRTTLAGEGLQHQDGHSHLVATTVPNCVAYDPAYAYELAVIVQDGMRRMFQEQESVFYYITCMNENYAHPAMPEGVVPGILGGMYVVRSGSAAAVAAANGAPGANGASSGGGTPDVVLFGSGTILREVLAAADLLEQQYGVTATVFSVTSFSELRRNALDVERWNLLHPAEPRREPFIQRALAGRSGPFVAASDYMKTVPDQIRQWVPGRYAVLGTDGFGRSDSRAELRRFFEIDRHYVVIAALKALADEGRFDRQHVVKAMQGFGIDPEKPNPLSV